MVSPQPTPREHPGEVGWYECRYSPRSWRVARWWSGSALYFMPQRRQVGDLRDYTDFIGPLVPATQLPPQEPPSRKVEDACEAIKRESERLLSLDRPRPLDLADVREFVEAVAAPQERNVWNVDSITARLATAERRAAEWEKWYRDIVADFCGVIADPTDPQRLHDWNWIESHRPPPVTDAFREAAELEAQTPITTGVPAGELRTILDDIRVAARVENRAFRLKSIDDLVSAALATEPSPNQESKTRR
jgi:hypothetical protein